MNNVRSASRSLLPARPPARRRGAGGWVNGCWRLALVALLTLPLLLSLTFPARANHLVGYDWRMTPLPGNQVRVRLTLYTDPAGGPSNSGGDPTATVAAYARATPPATLDRLVTTYVLPRVSTRGLPGPNPACSQASAPVLELIYEAVLTLDAVNYQSATGYYLVWERCCRNQSLSNLPDGQSAPMAATLWFPALPNPILGRPPNASPQFRAAPTATGLCVGAPAAVSFAAADADGDSLAYGLVALQGGFTSPQFPVLTGPNPGPYPPLAYSGSYSAARPLPGSFTLDPRTGLLAGVPTQVGTYGVAVVVREYRRGVQIGANHREIELTVVNCPPNARPSLTQVRPAPPDTVRITGAADRCLTLRGFDPDPGQTLTVQVLGGAPVVVMPDHFTVPFPAAAVELTICWTDCATPGAYPLTITLRDDGCRPSAPDTLRIPVRVLPAPNQPPIISREPPQPDTLTVLAGQEISFLALARDPNHDPLTLTLRPPADAIGLAPQTVQGADTARIAVRWTPPCTAARAAPYALWLRATDAACADATDSLRVLVRVRPLAALFPAGLPNVITPNADGYNDCFGLGRLADAPPAGGPCADDFREARIYSRWGRLVFITTDPAFCWNAAGLSAGTYHYLIRTAQRNQRGLLMVER